MTIQDKPTFPDDVLFRRLIDIAIERDSKTIVDDYSTGTQFGYRQILHGIAKLQQTLQGLLHLSESRKPGSVYVALLAPNGYEFIVGVIAVLAVGGVVVPMRELSYIIQQCNAQVMIVSRELTESATQIQREVEIPSITIEGNTHTSSNLPPAGSYRLDSTLAVSEETPSILFFTSGTTGPPKGVLHSRRTINKYAHMETEPATNDDICIIPRGAFWSIYFTKLFQMLLAGVRVEIQNFGRNYNLIWERLREQAGTKIVLSPTFWYGMMLHYESHISKLPEQVIQDYIDGVRYIRDACATGAMPSSRVKQFWQEMRGGKPLRVLYGSTETQEIAMWDGAIGSEEVIRHNERSICIVFKFFTYKVPRMEVEAKLTALPYVSEGYILPVQDPQCDTRTAALVRFHDSYDKIDLGSLRRDLAHDLPAYQLPTVLRSLREGETVPRTWSDKTAMMKVIQMFFPQDTEDKICGDATKVMDVSGFMKMKTTKLWELSGIR
ncbi:unnamed protein product [Aspergillus oryzae var. brunneus]|uniref:Unnamed protein product n=1 Tax=Aspergillus oryzae var. brunneus TaxID=332754 RepID=A0ABQ6KUG7_ASPOZ|nr:unnamed protein product [Aspergillus oryzae var. brunneus]